jgi:hypothetical protein
LRSKDGRLTEKAYEPDLAQNEAEAQKHEDAEDIQADGDVDAVDDPQLVLLRRLHDDDGRCDRKFCNSTLVVGLPERQRLPVRLPRLTRRRVASGDVLKPATGGRMQIMEKPPARRPGKK